MIQNKKDTISRTIKDLNNQNKMAFIPFVVAGDPNIETSKEILLTLQENGANIIELGIPYSDPLADGPVIQKAAKRSLSAGTTLKKAIEMVASLKERLTLPVIVFTYYNPILAYGIEKFITDIKLAGFSGVLVPDIPVEEASELIKLTQANDLELVMLVTPTSGDERIKKITEVSQGFVYLVSVTGVTGVRSNFSEHVENSLRKVKAFTDKPICVGFGISNPAHIRQLKNLNAQGAIVGSAIIKVIEDNAQTPENIPAKISEFIADLIKDC